MDNQVFQASVDTQLLRRAYVPNCDCNVRPVPQLVAVFKMVWAAGSELHDSTALQPSS